MLLPWRKHTGDAAGQKKGGCPGRTIHHAAGRLRDEVWHIGRGSVGMIKEHGRSPTAGLWMYDFVTACKGRMAAQQDEVEELEMEFGGSQSSKPLKKKK